MREGSFCCTPVERGEWRSPPQRKAGGSPACPETSRRGTTFCSCSAASTAGPLAPGTLAPPLSCQPAPVQGGGYRSARAVLHRRRRDCLRAVFPMMHFADCGHGSPLQIGHTHSLPVPRLALMVREDRKHRPTATGRVPLRHASRSLALGNPTPESEAGKGWHTLGPLAVHPVHKRYGQGCRAPEGALADHSEVPAGRGGESQQYHPKGSNQTPGNSLCW